jgi:UDP-2,4-diacetamido-2,4,6-trideoxy-beta-L-altropyranose hydrolase
MLKIAIRVDASNEIGSGHVMRCLTLANALKESGISVDFICRELLGNLCNYIEKKKFNVHRLPKNDSKKLLLKTKKDSNRYLKWLGVSLEDDAKQTLGILQKNNANFDCLIVDHYALHEAWEKQMRPYVGKIMVIDDLANRKHDCDLLLDQNLYEMYENRYDDLVPPNCQKLLGPKYVLLRREFLEKRQKLKERNGIVNRILIFFGGNDKSKQTVKALEAISHIKKANLSVDVVIGHANTAKENIKSLCDKMSNVKLHCKIENMAELMENADLAIGAGGTTTWERIFLGLPSCVIAIAANQQKCAHALAKMGYQFFWGTPGNLEIHEIMNELDFVFSQKHLLMEMSKKCLDLIKGNGTNLVRDKLLGG